MIAQEDILEPLQLRRRHTSKNLFYKVIELIELITGIAPLYLCYKVLLHEKF